jgi:hypothetical protein
MAGFTAAFPNSLKLELATAIQDFSSGGDAFALALGVAAPTGTYGPDTTNYSDLTGNSDELPNGSGYVTGGFVWTNVQNITPAISGSECVWSWSVNPSWVAATFSTSGCVIYNKTKSNRAAYVGNFGGIIPVSSNTLTLLLPANTAGSSILALT